MTLNDSPLVEVPNYDNYIDWDGVSEKFFSGGLSVLHINMRSLANKYAELTSHLSIIRGKFTFVILTEVWLNESRDVGFELSGYKSFSVYRNSQIGGGIKIYYLDNITANIVEECSGCFRTHESLLLSAYIPSFGKLSVCGVYRIPNTPMENFITSMNDILVRNNSIRSIICGDVNLNILKNPISRDCFNYTQLMSSYGYENVIEGYTYVSPSNNSEISCIDHVWFNFVSVNAHGYIIRPNLSDHYPVCIMLDVSMKSENSVNFHKI